MFALILVFLKVFWGDVVLRDPRWPSQWVPHLITLGPQPPFWGPASGEDGCFRDGSRDHCCTNFQSALRGIVCCWTWTRQRRRRWDSGGKPTTRAIYTSGMIWRLQHQHRYRKEMCWLYFLKLRCISWCSKLVEIIIFLSVCGSRCHLNWWRSAEGAASVDSFKELEKSLRRTWKMLRLHQEHAVPFPSWHPIKTAKLFLK